MERVYKYKVNPGMKKCMQQVDNSTSKAPVEFEKKKNIYEIHLKEVMLKFIWWTFDSCDNGTLKSIAASCTNIFQVIKFAAIE